MTNAFGQIFRQERKRAGMTLGDVARVLEVAVTYVSDVERGTRAPLSRDRILAVTAAMGTTADVQKALLHAAVAHAQAYSLSVPQSESGRELGVALMRGWNHFSENTFAEILDLVKKKGVSG